MTSAPRSPFKVAILARHGICYDHCRRLVRWVMEDQVKALALIEQPGHVCYRYRVEAFGHFLSKQGIELDSVGLDGGTLRRTKKLRAARLVDVVIIQRKLLPVWQLAILRRMTKCLVYDFDDAVFRHDSYHAAGSTGRRRLARFWATVYTADRVIAGNEFLRRRAADYVGNQRVVTIPTCVDPDRYPIARHDRSSNSVERQDPVRLVWIGQQSTLGSLEQIGQHLAEATKRRPSLELRVIADDHCPLPGVRVIPIRWTQATEMSDLAASDIGIAWLPDDAWSRGKCGLKVLQYMAAGLPVVANPVGVHSEIIVDGETGFLVSTPQEWVDAIDRLASDPTLCRRMGRTGRHRVEKRYSIAAWGPQFVRSIVPPTLASEPVRY